eukprot:TRINITY_DN3254_c0_g2_i1.p1 TRINITY_DN3254_c0_g2~~TRINITY_DN3254_c0_g2_i1.p1  ORF type:complete len:378 (+),score=120.00 TRINITY_DN3254_c0_g2_i1:73-1134(+)
MTASPAPPAAPAPAGVRAQVPEAAPEEQRAAAAPAGGEKRRMRRRKRSAPRRRVRRDSVYLGKHDVGSVVRDMTSFLLACRPEGQREVLRALRWREECRARRQRGGPPDRRELRVAPSALLCAEVSTDDAPYGMGASVAAVAAGSAADRTGLRVGMHILKAAGQRVRSAADLAAALSELPAGEETVLRVELPDLRCPSDTEMQADCPHSAGGQCSACSGECAGGGEGARCPRCGWRLCAQCAAGCKRLRMLDAVAVKAASVSSAQLGALWMRRNAARQVPAPPPPPAADAPQYGGCRTGRSVFRCRARRAGSSSAQPPAEAARPQPPEAAKPPAATAQAVPAAVQRPADSSAA